MTLQLFLKGYNHGYILAFEKPELLKEFEAITQFKTTYAVGFAEGAKHGQKKRINQNLKPMRGKDEGMSM